MASVNWTKKKDGTKEKVPCPKAVAVYDNVMGGVDRFDQREERHQIRRSEKWWNRLFYFFIDLAIKNSFILWQVITRNRGLDQLTFRMALCRIGISLSANRWIFLKKKERTFC
ncbi:piggyBac transposable element-derived protein 4 [Trichonephila clavipes]|nr:piggyBac transposable element-derived protein 4 [Trichonephila clavipes]